MIFQDVFWNKTPPEVVMKLNISGHCLCGSVSFEYS